MAVTEQAGRDRRAEARRVHEPGGRRAGCDARRRARRDRRSARPLQGDGGRRPDHVHATRRVARARRSATCASGSTPRPRAATSPTTRRPSRYTLPAEQALALADESSPFFLCGAFQGFTSLVRDEPKIREAFTSGAGVGWHEHHHDLFEGTERFFRTGYNAHLVAEWIPALDGVEAQAARRHSRGRRRLRARRLDDPDGEGVPGLAVRRLRLPRGVHRGCAPARRGRRRDRSRALRGRARERLHGHLRPRHHVRLPARHGRPGRRGAPRRSARSRTTARG